MRQINLATLTILILCCSQIKAFLQVTTESNGKSITIIELPDKTIKIMGNNYLSPINNNKVASTIAAASIIYFAYKLWDKSRPKVIRAKLARSENNFDDKTAILE